MLRLFTGRKMPYPAARRDASTTTKSTKSYQDLKCKIEQCGGRCLRAGEVCRLVPDERQQKIWMGALKKVGKIPAVASSAAKKGAKRSTAPRKTKVAIPPSPSGFLKESDAAKKFDLIGSGIDGNVYLDKKNNIALKYFQHDSTVLDDNFINQLRLADKLGVGPKFYGHDRVELNGFPGRDRPVFSMEYLKDHTVGLHPHTIDVLSPTYEKDVAPYAQDFLKKLKIIHDNDLVFDDLHEQNIMANNNKSEVKFIDIGFTENATYKEKAIQLLNTFHWRPMPANIARERIEYIHKKDKKKINEFKKLSKMVGLGDPKLKTESDYAKVLQRAYELLELDK